MRPVNTMRERNSLHLSQVKDFSRWLEQHGWERKPKCGYEILRMAHTTYDGPLLVWKKLGAKEHATIQGVSARWYKRWKNEQAAGDTRSNQDSNAQRAQAAPSGTK